MSCANPGTPGSCQPAADNTDIRNQCGICHACFSGLCAPALVGTDPNGSCSSSERCGAQQTCGHLGGSDCSSDSDCAVGECIDGRCLEHRVEQIFGYPMYPAPTARHVESLAANQAGDATILFTEYSETVDSSGIPTIMESDLFAAIRSRDQDWNIIDLFKDGYVPGNIPSAVTYLGRWAYLVTSNQLRSQSGACSSEEPCGLFGRFVSPGGQLAHIDVIDPAMQKTTVVLLDADGAGGLALAYGDDAKLAVRTGKPGAEGNIDWSAATAITDYDSSARPALAVANGRPVLFYQRASAPGLVVQLFNPAGQPQPVPLPKLSDGSNCNLTSVSATREAAAGGGDEVVFGAICGVALEGVFRPVSAGADRFSTEAGSPQMIGLLPVTQGGRPPLFATYWSDVSIEARLAWMEPGAGWTAKASFIPVGLSEVYSMRASAGLDGAPVLAIATGPQQGAPPQIPQLVFVRYHP